MIYQTLGMLALLAFIYSAISGWIERTPINGALVYTAFGLAFGGMGLGLIGFDIEAEGFRVIAEITLGVVLFSDAAGTDFKLLKRNLDVPQRLLLIGLPLTILLGVGVGIALFDNLSIIEIAIIATMLAPTDAALGKAVVSDPRVPAPMRQSLNVESGLNDGICVPVLFAFLALASEGDGESDLLILLVEEIGIGAICGLGVELHPILTHLPPIFASKIDPRVTLIPAQCDAGVPRSDKRGLIECNQAVAPTGWALHT